MKRIPESELIVNADGSIFHLHLKPEQLADRVVLAGDPARIGVIAERFDRIECDVQSREFRTITGYYRGKRITALSHGIGGDNIDIVLTELDALANIDLATRTVNPRFRQLTLVRIGTSGSLQPDLPVGTYLAAARSVGFDSVPYFYEGHEQVRDLALEVALARRLAWPVERMQPYAVAADDTLLQQIAQHDIPHVITLAANGFYGPQGREVRLRPAHPSLNAALAAFEYDGLRVANYEMESAALAALAALMRHRALTLCCIIAGRTEHRVDTGYTQSITGLIDLVLERI